MDAYTHHRATAENPWNLRNPPTKPETTAQSAPAPPAYNPPARTPARIRRANPARRRRGGPRSERSMNWNHGGNFAPTASRRVAGGRIRRRGRDNRGQEEEEGEAGREELTSPEMEKVGVRRRREERDLGVSIRVARGGVFAETPSKARLFASVWLAGGLAADWALAPACFTCSVLCFTYSLLALRWVGFTSLRSVQRVDKAQTNLHRRSRLRGIQRISLHFIYPCAMGCC
jgi:hypothetical protein